VKTGSAAHPTSFKRASKAFRRGKSGQSVKMSTHPLQESVQDVFMAWCSARGKFTFVLLKIGVTDWKHFFTPHNGSTTGCWCNSASVRRISCTEIRNYDDYGCVWCSTKGLYTDTHLVSTIQNSSYNIETLIFYFSVGHNLQRCLANEEAGLTQRLFVCIL
jgi:hypothetical protein